MQPDKKRLFKALVREGLEVSYDQTSHVYTIRGVGDSNSPPAEVLLHESLPLEAKAVKQLANLASAHHPHGGHVCRACATPDFHPGDSGVAIGSVVETADILIPQAVGTDINCFTGDTLIPLLDGTDKTLKEIVDSGVDPWVWVISKDHNITGARATAKRTRVNQSLIQVTLDNTEKVRCTPDHLWMRRDGSYVRADRLSAGDSLMPLYKTKDGYVRVKQPCSGRWQRAHWAIARGGALGPLTPIAGQKPVLHHKNFNKSDNSPENLQYMGHLDHLKLHRDLAAGSSHAWQSEAFEIKRKLALRRKADSPEGKIFYAQRASGHFTKYHRENKDAFRKAVANNGKHGAPVLVKYNTSEKGRAKSKEIAAREYTCPHCGMVGRGGFFFPNHISKCQVKTSNHSVVSVEMLSEREDVYCLSVPGFENFAISAGVFVHNCGMRLHTTDLTLDRFLGGKAQLVEKMKGDYLLGTRNLPLKSHQVRAMLEEGIPSWLESMAGPRGGQLENLDLDQLWLETNRVFELGSMRGDASLLPDLLTTERDPGLGTIGRGNHFVEIQVVDEILDKQLAWEWGVRQGAICYMIHSGSRDVGKHLGSIWETRAREDWPREVPHPASGIFPLRVGTELARRYLEAEATAANYAFVNRLLLAEMMRIRMREVFGAVEAPLVYDIPHNITLREGDRYVARKGACPARAGVPVIVPGSMGTESFLLVGLGNDRHISSASHGAGRAKSRGSMGRFVKDDAHMKALGLTGIECITLREERRVEEAPAAYKPIRPVIDVQVEAGIVAPVAKLKPILTFKS